MILWPLFFLSMAFAQDPSVEEYCFSSVARTQQVSQRLKFIMVPADKMELNERCFTISTPSHRRELIQNYVRKIDPSVQINFSSAELRREPCHIKVEKVRTLNSNSVGGKVTTDISINLAAEQSAETSTDTSTIQTIKEFELTVNQDSIKGECRVINQSLYEITLVVAKDAIPLVPPLPPGTVAVVTDAQIYKTQQTSKLQTTLQLQRGQRMEIGNVVRQLRNDAHKVDIQNSAGVDKTTGTENERVFLSLD